MNSQGPTLGAQAPASRRVKPEWRADYVERGTTAPKKYAIGDAVKFVRDRGKGPTYIVEGWDAHDAHNWRYVLRLPGHERQSFWVPGNQIEPALDEQDQIPEQQTQATQQGNQPVNQQNDASGQQQNEASAQRSQTQGQGRRQSWRTRRRSLKYKCERS